MGKSKRTTESSIDFPNNHIIQTLLRKRNIIFNKLQTFEKHIDSIEKVEDELTLTNLNLRINSATSIFNEFDEIQTKLEELINDDEINEQVAVREHFENKYFKIMATAKCISNSHSSTPQKPNSTNSSSVKLPIISMPSFDGRGEHWLEFRDTFVSLVHESTEISNIQKFHYLKSSLQGTAKSVIDSIEFSSDNYKTAWDMLVNRYDNNRLLVQNHVKSLFTIPPIVNESASALRNLVDTILKNLRALKILKEPTEAWDTLIIYLTVSKLDQGSEREWERFRSLTLGKDDNKNNKPTLEDLLNFIKNRADMLETLQAKKVHFQNAKLNPKRDHTTLNNNKIHCYVSRKDQVTNNCFLCHENHFIYSCKQFLDLDIGKRQQIIKKHKICENCLRPGHELEQCKFGSCKKCGKKHNTLLHFDNFHSANTVNTPNDNSQVYQTQPISSFTVTQSSTANTVMLPTAIVKVKDDLGKFQIARLLLDNGSERCFISKALCDKLNLRTSQCSHQLKGIGGLITKTLQTCSITIKSCINSFSTNLTCFVIDEITSSLPSEKIPKLTFEIPDHVKLADPKFFVPDKIDILIGADKFWELLKEGRIKLSKGPILQNTSLGWIVSGPINTLNYPILNKPIRCNFTQSVEAQLRKFWELEEVQTPPNSWSEEEIQCEKHFVQNTTRNKDGRFCVAIPFKESPSILGDSYTIAKRQFLSLEKRLNKEPNLKRLYKEFIHEYIELGHMSKIDKVSDTHYFLPHHGVLRENSTTTKLRVVFNASAVTSSGKSLNDIQLVGPPIQGDLFAILLRFRQYKYTACADIEKMYRQCLVNPNQRHLQLILWRDNEFDVLQSFQLNTVTYGTASAPFLSIRCLKQCALASNDSEVETIVNNHFYVDDLLLSHDNKDELINLCERVTEALKKGCFPLRKWRFNFEITNNFENINEPKQITPNETGQSKTLGLGWSNISDEFHFNTQIDTTETSITKRIILSKISKIFDPLGLVSPLIITAKIILQRLWLSKVEWDEPIPSNLLIHWEKFVNSIKILNNIKIPRHVMVHNPKHVSLHVFTDASQVAYGTCIYLRTMTESQEVVVRLLCSKSKVAPIKPISIPRLELCGAGLGAKLYSKVQSAVQVKIDQVIFWTDSTIVLGWLRMAPGLLKTFVQNRVSEIHELTKGHSWRHVSGKENPADLVSRGLEGKELAECSLWWNGPQFLLQSTFNISNFPVRDILEELPEIKPQTIHSFKIVTDTQNLIEFERFSQLNRLKRAFAYVLRFITNVRSPHHKRQSGDLSIDELKNSEIQLAILAQRESFPDEYKALQKGEILHQNSKLIPLNPFYDNHGVIRVGGRIQYSAVFEYNKKHPIVLAGKHHFSILLFRHTHKMLFHAPSQTVLYHLRETWWPIGGQNVIKKIIHDCIICKRFKAKPASPIMGNLPESRITPSFPFDRCGVDYAGPVLTLSRKGRGARLQKSYICLFICFTTRAVHLELVSDLSSNSYLLALKRFISRKGKPTEIISDNGKNFIGVMREFKIFISNNSIQKEITTFSIENNIKFSFIPPYSPHFGGLWEAGVKSCKHHLVRTVRNAHLTFEELYTILSQIEAIINSRPLSPLSSDANDLQPLTPGHFLIGRAFTSPVFASFSEIQKNQLSRFKHLEKIRQNFWERWSKEYISHLQTRIKWKTSKSKLTPDTLVVIKEDNLPPLYWRLGRIVKIFPGQDGIPRVAEIKTKTGVITRSFSKICPLLQEDQKTQ